MNIISLCCQMAIFKRNCNTTTIFMMTFEAKVGWSGPVVVDLFCQSCFSNFDGWFFKIILATLRLQIFDKIVRFCTRSVTDSQEALQLTTKSLFNRFLQNAKLKPFWGTSRDILLSVLLQNFPASYFRQTVINEMISIVVTLEKKERVTKPWTPRRSVVSPIYGKQWATGQNLSKLNVHPSSFAMGLLSAIFAPEKVLSTCPHNLSWFSFVYPTFWRRYFLLHCANDIAATLWVITIFE